ncbi:MAG: CRISPR-associated endonuclease Cas2 [Deltaproteobacteria bacterium]|nr:CRISPR-associated endonuclease Cas2 [Deltaproteobacteria bacterium]
MRCLIVYDVSDDRRRRQVAKALERSGVRVQKSAFELDIDPSELRELLRTIENRIARQTDRVVVVPLTARGLQQVRWLGAGPLESLPARKADYWLV